MAPPKRQRRTQALDDLLGAPPDGYVLTGDPDSDAGMGWEDPALTPAEVQALAKSPVPLFTDAETVATTSTDGTEDDLLLNTIPAGTLAADGDRIEFEYVLNGAAHATATRRYRAYFAGTVFTDSNNLAATAGHWAEMQGSIIRVSATAVRVLYELVAATDTTKQPIAIVMGAADRDRDGQARHHRPGPDRRTGVPCDGHRCGNGRRRGRHRPPRRHAHLRPGSLT